MELEKSQEHLAEIHRHLARTEVYRGYRARFVAISGVMALIGALFQPVWPEGPQKGFVLYWAALAAANVTLISANILWDSLKSSPFLRRKTLSAVGQLIPSLLAGFLLTWAVYFQSPTLIPYLPGLWTLCFSLGVFASTPYLPSCIPYVAGYYLCAALVLLSLAPSGMSLNPWAMGLTFGVGQVLGALVLHFQTEKENDGSQAD